MCFYFQNPMAQIYFHRFHSVECQVCVCFKSITATWLVQTNGSKKKWDATSSQIWGAGGGGGYYMLLKLRGGEGGGGAGGVENTLTLSGRLKYRAPWHQYLEPAIRHEGSAGWYRLEHETTHGSGLMYIWTRLLSNMCMYYCMCHLTSSEVRAAFKWMSL